MCVIEPEVPKTVSDCFKYGTERVNQSYKEIGSWIYILKVLLPSIFILDPE